MSEAINIGLLQAPQADGDIKTGIKTLFKDLSSTSRSSLFSQIIGGFLSSIHHGTNTNLHQGKNQASPFCSLPLPTGMPNNGTVIKSNILGNGVVLEGLNPSHTTVTQASGYASLTTSEGNNLNTSHNKEGDPTVAEENNLYQKLTEKNKGTTEESKSSEYSIQNRERKDLKNLLSELKNNEEKLQTEIEPDPDKTTQDSKQTNEKSFTQEHLLSDIDGQEIHHTSQPKEHQALQHAPGLQSIKHHPVRMEKLIEDIQHLNTIQNKGGHAINLTIESEGLGKIALHVSVNNHHVRADFIADHIKSLMEIQSNLPDLFSSLHREGLTPGDFNFMLKDQTRRDNLNGQNTNTESASSEIITETTTKGHHYISIKA